MAIVNEVITKFGFQGSVAPLHDYNDTLGQSVTLLATAAAGIVAAAGALGAFTIATTQSLDPMIQLSRSTGVAVDNLHELSFAASVSGSSSEALQSSIAALSDKIGEAAQQGSEDFSRLGISIRNANGEIKTADQVLLELTDRFDRLNLSLQERRSFAQRLGIDASLVQLLSKTSGEIDALLARARELGSVTEEQAEAAVRLNDSYTTLRFGLDGLRNSVAVGLAPRMEELSTIFIDFLATNREVISEGIGRTIEIIQALAGAIVRLLPTIGLMAGAFFAWKVASLGLAGALGLIFSPVILASAAIVGLLLIVDDLIVALDGGRSVIADFFQEFFGVDIVTPLRAAVETTKALFSALLDTGRGFIAGLQDAFSGFFALINGDFDLAAEFFGKTFDRILGFGSAAFDQLVELFSGLAAKLSQELGDLGQIILNGLSGLTDSALQLGSDIVDALTAPIRAGFNDLVEWIKGKLAVITNLGGNVASFFGFGDSEEADLQDQRTGGFGSVEVPEDQSMGRRARLTTDLQEQRTGGFGAVEAPADEVLFRRVHLVNMISEDSQIQADQTGAMLDTLTMPREIQVDFNLSDLSESVSAAVDVMGDPELSAQQVLRPQTSNVDNRSRSTTIEQRNEFNISAENPRQVSDTVVDGLNRQLRDARTQFDVGGM